MHSRNPSLEVMRVKMIQFWAVSRFDVNRQNFTMVACETGILFSFDVMIKFHFRIPFRFRWEIFPVEHSLALVQILNCLLVPLSSFHFYSFHSVWCYLLFFCKTFIFHQFAHHKNKSAKIKKNQQIWKFINEFELTIGLQNAISS